MALVHIEMSEYKAMEAKAEMLEEMRQTERKFHEEIKSIEQKKNAEWWNAPSVIKYLKNTVKNW